MLAALTEGADRSWEPGKLKSADGCSREPRLREVCARKALVESAICLNAKTIGDTGDASNGDCKAEFVAEAASDEPRSAAVCRPDAVIFLFKPVRPTESISHLASLFLKSSIPLARRLAPKGAEFAPACCVAAG